MAMKQAKKPAEILTTPDLVLLSLLAERGMHGYQANLELERRCVRDWAGISRPQVSYSLEKLAAVWLVSLMIEEFRAELKWLKKVERELKRRGRARFPAYAEGEKD